MRNSFRTILCPTDFSDYSRRALDLAVVLGRRYHATVTVLHVHPSEAVSAYATGLPLPGPVGLTELDREQLRSAVRSFANTESAPEVRLETALREGNAGREIVAAAAAMAADLLVLGTHGRSGFDRLILGSVAERVLRTAPCPVLTVPPRHPDATPADAAVFSSILCPVDFSESSLRALDGAAALAHETGAKLTVLHVIDALDDVLTAPELVASGLTLGEYLERRHEDYCQRLTQVAASAAAGGAVASEVAQGHPGREILRIADRRQHDLIVIGVRGRGAVDRALFGSTAQHVVRGACCPVLTVGHD